MANSILQGVAFNDSNGNWSYSAGEGIAGLLVSNADGESVTTNATGGYTIEFGDAGKAFTLSGAGLAAPVTVTPLSSTANLVIDLVNGNTLLASGSITVDSAAIVAIRGTGTRGLALMTNTGAQRITGTEGSDVINTGFDNDVIIPGNGNDSVDGGAGVDLVVYSGASSLYIVGGATGGLWTVTGNGVGADVLSNVEVLRFSNGDFVYNRSTGTLVPYTGAPVGNTAPTISVSTLAVATDANVAKTVTVAASDVDGDALTYSASAAAHGVITGGSGGVFTYTPTRAYTGPDTFVVSVNDGKGGIVTQTVTVTINPVQTTNTAPVVASAQSVSAIQNTAKTITVGATDPDGDVLAFSSGAAAHGTVTGGNAGVFTYTPSVGYVGSDSFVVSVNDGKGHVVNQVVNVAVAASSGPGSPTPTFRLFTSDGFSGEVGGSGTVLGSNGAEDIKLITSIAGNISFDTSFNRGNDVIRLPGSASSYQVARVNSAAVVTDGTHSYTVPFGEVGTEIAFSDGVRTLTFNATNSQLFLGNQVVGTSAVAITAPSEGPGEAIVQLPNASGLVYLGAGADVALGGKYQVVGTSSNEDITYKYGDISLDASFNRGGDALLLPTGAANFSAYVVGSMVVLKSALGTVTIPWGDAGLALNFNGDVRSLQYDSAGQKLMIGGQAIVGTSAVDATVLSSSNSGGGAGGSSLSADVGTAGASATLVLDSSKAYTLSDNALTSNFVYVKGFNLGDTISVTNAAGSDYNYTTVNADSDGKWNDLEITFNDGSNVNYMVLVDAVTGMQPIFNETTAELAFGSNFITFG